MHTSFYLVTKLCGSLSQTFQIYEQGNPRVKRFVLRSSTMNIVLGQV